MYTNEETETLILKRLESALANEDNGLLKIAAYKLHEKFHTGYTFEYKKQLKEVLDYVEKQTVFEEETVLLLTSTIREILNQKEKVFAAIDSVFPAPNNFKTYEQQKIAVEEDKEAGNIIEDLSEDTTISYSENLAQIKPEEPTFVNIEEENLTQIKPEEPTFVNIEEENLTDTQITAPEGVIREEMLNKTEHENFEERIAVFYGEKNTDIDNNFIKDFQFALGRDESFSKTLGELKAFINLVESDLSALSKIILALKNCGKEISFITSSLNGKLLDLFRANEINIEADWKFYPLYGLTRLLECRGCGRKHLELNETQSLVSACRVCSDYMLPTFRQNTSCDTLCLGEAMESLINSNTWILINPPKADTNLAAVKMFELALRAKKPSMVYILTQDEIRKDFYREMFNLKGIETKTDYFNNDSFCEDFSKDRDSNKTYALHY